jgi:hypothetical protein
MTTATKAKTGTGTATKDGLTSMIAYLTRVLKTPTIGAFWEELAEQARDENWSHEEYLAALLQRQVADRESKGTVIRICTAHFPQVKTLELSGVLLCPSGTSVSVEFTRLSGRWCCAIRGCTAASVTSAAWCRASAEGRVR